MELNHLLKSTNYSSIIPVDFGQFNISTVLVGIFYPMSFDVFSLPIIIELFTLRT